MGDARRSTTEELIQAGVLEIGDGYRAKNAEFEGGGGLPFVRVGNVSLSGVQVDGLDELPERERSKYEPKVSRPGDSLITMKGTVGRVAFVGQRLRPFVYSPQISYWRSHDPETVDPRWLRYWLEGPEFSWQASATKGSTDMADYINLRDQRRMMITLPPSHVQRQIAEVLGTIDDLIENNRRRIEVLEEMARAIYREWFVHFRYPGHESVPLVDSPLGPIPEGWTVMAASEAVVINPRLKSSREHEGPFITMGDLPVKGLTVFPSEYRAGGSGAKFQNGDVLFARITPSLENGKTALVQGLEAGEIARGSTEFIVLRGKSVGRAFTYFLARSDDFRDHAIKSMAGASGRQRVRNECFDTFMLPIPSPSLADEFEALAQPLLTLIHEIARQSETAERLRNALLPKLVTGQIDVSDIDLDALASSVGG